MNTLPTTLFLAQYATTLFMTGLIWFVQIVHYPLFATIHAQTSSAAFRSYEHQHANRTGWVVFPPMLVEILAAFAALLPGLRAAFVSKQTAIASAILVLLIWIATGLLQIPLHNRLSAAPDAPTIRRLVRSNWLRTLLWTSRAALLTYILPRHI